MALLSIGGALGALGTAMMQNDLTLGLIVALVAFLMIGVGVGAAGTSLLTLRQMPEVSIRWGQC